MSGAARLIGRAALVVLALASFGRAGAQSILDGELRLAPQYVQYRVHDPADETISELAVPLFVIIPAGARLTFDVGTAYARAHVRSGGQRSEVVGLTDTQLRGNLTLGSDFIVLTAGVNLPTGNASVALDQLTAAGRIGNDFLGFPVSNMGTGLAATGGIAVAYPMGVWNVGIGAAFRRSSAYEPFDVPGQRFRYQPGNEVRARAGVDRTIASGRLALGLTYSAFGREDAGGSAYNTGDRVIAQGVLTSLVGEHELTLAAYNVFRGPGEYASGDRAGRENIANALAAFAMRAGGVLVEPSVEVRHWLQTVLPSRGSSAAEPERSQSSVLATLAVRTRLGLGHASLYPGVGYSLGRMAALDESGRPARARLDGFRLQVAMRVAP